MERLGSDDGCPPLALPPLGSFLWSFSAIPDLSRCDIANHDFLEAIRALAFTRDDRMLRPVDYKNLGSEELGSVYESLLELHPELCVDAPTFTLDTACGGNVFRRGNDVYLPLYEGKLFHHFDHRWATHDSLDTRDLTSTEKANPEAFALPRYWVPADEVNARLADEWRHGWLLGWRNITNTTNERTVIASVMPRGGVGHSSPLIFSSVAHPALAVSLQANLSAIAFDFIARQKIGGTNLTYGYVNQMPILPYTTYSCLTPWAPGETLSTWLLLRVLELNYTA
jgi:hypothetical protein